ncbi:MAG TPA: undecaprenyl-diphosphate phosphatase, partial [Planctomycetaceae bacterium]|nr:undecaprenyl-diphosphate phosphatase [Planctomycetaceae bacterium]
ALLALIQGAAELLPVSSSAHVILAQRVMGMDPSRPEQVFLLVMLHTGTMFAVLVYFWPRWRRLWGPKNGTATNGRGAEAGSLGQFLTLLIVATAVTGVVALGLKFVIEHVILVDILKRPKGEIEELFKYLPVVAAGLAAVGVLILAAGGRDSANTGRLTGGSAIWIGLVQGFCVPFRGFSRSGATISTGLLRGASRAVCEDFSFALAVVLTPPAQAYSVYKLLKAHELSRSTLMEVLVPGLVGMVFSFAAGFLALRFLSAVLERGRWKYFGFYCLAMAAVILAANFLLPPA